jgi:hypothetical protein
MTFCGSIDVDGVIVPFAKELADAVFEMANEVGSLHAT